MNQPWYWWVEEEIPYEQQQHVVIKTFPRDSVRGQYLVLPFNVRTVDKDGNSEYTDWNVYMQPLWTEEQGFNVEWVFHHREKRPKFRKVPRGVEKCECCGHEERVWEYERIED